MMIKTSILDENSINNELRLLIDKLNPWHQKIKFSEDIVTPGKWDCEKQFNAITESLSIPCGQKILDCGSNAGGITYEFAKRGHIVTSIETSQLYLKQQKLYQEYKIKSGEKFISNVSIIDDTLFNAHCYGQFDIILMLGLVYHFRYPQLFLDYCSTLNGKTFIFSTQAVPGDDMVMRNRNLKYKTKNLMGWEPSVQMFEVMLKAAGFFVESFFCTSELDFTNNAYFICRKEQTLDIDPEIVSKLCLQSLIWS